MQKRKLQPIVLRYNILSAGLYRYNVLVDCVGWIGYQCRINTALEGIMGPQQTTLDNIRRDVALMMKQVMEDMGC